MPRAMAAMVQASIFFHVRRDKRSEFLRAAETFVALLRQSGGCLDCHLLTDCEERDSYMVLSQWDARASLRVYLGSNDFRALLGTRILLRDPPRVCIDEVTRRTRLNSRVPVAADF